MACFVTEGFPTAAQTTCVLFDTGSQRSYVTCRIQDLLRLPTKGTETLVVKTFGAEPGRSQTCDVVDPSICARDGMSIVMALLTVPLIYEPLSGQHASKRYPYLSKLDLADLGESSSHMDVDILISADNYWSLVTG